MQRSLISRRRFNKWVMSGLVAGVCPLRALANKPGSKQIKAAAIQMVPRLGDLQWNLRQADTLIQKAIKQGAQWIMLPEMFTTAAAFHSDILKAIQPFDGAPLQLLKEHSRKSNVVIGGSFLAERNGDVFNTFALVFPDGHVVTHDKDSPTYWENCYYRGGSDDGVLQTPAGPVGSVLCWEFIRSRTARRLKGKVKMVVGGSCWWTLPDDADADSPRRADNLKMLQDAPVRMARMLGVPVIHGSHAGRFEGFFSPDLPDVAYNSSYLGEAMIVDANGNVMVRRAKAEGEGVVTAEFTIPDHSSPTEQIPKTFWIPKEMPEDWKESWERWLDIGADYYKNITLSYIKTGIQKEYIPTYMRE